MDAVCSGEALAQWFSGRVAYAYSKLFGDELHTNLARGGETLPGSFELIKHHRSTSRPAWYVQRGLVAFNACISIENLLQL